MERVVASEGANWLLEVQVYNQDHQLNNGRLVCIYFSVVVTSLHQVGQPSIFTPREKVVGLVLYVEITNNS